MSFVSSVMSPEEKTEPALWFVFQDHQLMVCQEENKVSVPTALDLEELNLKPVREQYIGTLNGAHCYSAELSLKTLWPDNMNFLGLRQLHAVLDPDTLKVAVNAIQIVNWDQTHQYCGRCGAPTETKSDERAKVCPECSLINYPRLAPAIMAAIIKDNEILLANGQNFPPGFFSVLAGFVEPGETLEECVAREVKEEVGLEVKNIKYFNSQPWPFPHSLMIAFTAEYAGGEIAVDGVEIVKADWFAADKLPHRPPANISIAGRLIDWFQDNY
ncbi:MAG: NAD(+) diphosphatase [Proteobacteria bacterium]|nr:NAD(+) diphosphatase [Pseudomonadota bacterium]